MKAYFCEYDACDGTGEAFVAKNAREARNMAWRMGEWGGDFIDLKVKRIEGANVEGLPSGVVKGNADAVSRGIYQWVEDTCPRCGKDTRISFSEDCGAIVCRGCEDALLTIKEAPDA